MCACTLVKSKGLGAVQVLIELGGNDPQDTRIHLFTPGLAVFVGRIACALPGVVALSIRQLVGWLYPPKLLGDLAGFGLADGANVAGCQCA
jgi:hypothetical protein